MEIQYAEEQKLAIELRKHMQPRKHTIKKLHEPCNGVIEIDPPQQPVVTSNPVFVIVRDILCPIAAISPSIAYSSSSTGRAIPEEDKIYEHQLKEKTNINLGKIIQKIHHCFHESMVGSQMFDQCRNFKSNFGKFNKLC